MISLRTALFAILLAGASPAAAANAPCDMHDADADAAQALRARDPAGAEKLADAILRADPQDFRATYTKALALFDQSNIMHATNYDRTKVQAGFAQIATAVKLLEAMNGACLVTAKSLGWGSVYNSQGVYYFATGDKKTAETIWLNAYNTKQPLMLVKTRVLLLNNLGLLYDDSNLKNPALTAKYRQEALALQFKANPATLTAPTRLQRMIPRF